MKPKHLMPAIILLLFFSGFQLSFASGGNIIGQVMDTTLNQPVSDAMVVLDCRGNQLTYITNQSGYYYASNIPAGSYIVAVVDMGKTYKKGIELASDETREVNFSVGSIIQIDTFIYTYEKDPIINPLDPTAGKIDKKEIAKMPVTDAKQLAENISGVEEFNGQYYVHGARAGALAYYIDGCKIMGNPDIPLCGLDSYRSYTDYIPAKYGDATGGVIAIETRNYFKENH